MDPDSLNPEKDPDPEFQVNPATVTDPDPIYKFINFFLCLWVIFALLYPDMDAGTPLNPDLDQQHCYRGSKWCIGGGGGGDATNWGVEGL